MKKNELIKINDTILRILDFDGDSILTINCKNRNMPKFIEKEFISGGQEISESEMQTELNHEVLDIEEFNPKDKEIIYRRFSIIADILPVTSNVKLRNEKIRQLSIEYDISQQTIRNYLCLYLIFQSKTILAPKSAKTETQLTSDEKNIRWALNKFFYSRKRNSLPTAYTLMLKEKYCNECGELSQQYPTFNQFRYFYRKTRNIRNYYITRNGLTDYQRNHRPLLGDCVQEFSPNIGTCMLDSTICDIYLVDDSGRLIGRPILIAAIDSFSQLCCGYALLQKGGMYSLRELMFNIIEDKQELCKKLGIQTTEKSWDCKGQLPSVFVTDKGNEYKSENFEQLSELGVSIINLPAYRPELKGYVEKFFDVVQELYKPVLKGKGVVEPDFQQRGSRDYRKDACLTMVQFERIILHCILYYNNERVIENYPYTNEMLEAKIKPYSSDIWQWGKTQPGAKLIPVDKERLYLALLPRTKGKFSRKGLIVNGIRYKNENFVEEYLSGKTVDVAYDTHDVGFVWLIENSNYIKFTLIENRYRNMNIEEANSIKTKQKELIRNELANKEQAKINLFKSMELIVESVGV